MRGDSSRYFVVQFPAHFFKNVHYFPKMAGVIKRGNVYFATYWVDGKNVRRTTKIHVVPKKGDNMGARELKKFAQMTAERMEAVEKRKTTLDAAMAALRAVSPVSGGFLTLEELVNEYVSGLSEKARRLNAPFFSRFLKIFCHLRYRASSDFKKTDAQQLVTLFCEDGLKGSTVRVYIKLCRKLFVYAIDRHVVMDNPFNGLSLPKIAESERRAFSLKELGVLFEALSPEWRDFVAVCLLLGGQRMGDVALFRWDSIDVEHRVVSFSTRKTKKKLVKPIIAPLLKILERRASGWMRQDEYVFPEFATSYLRLQNVYISRRFRAILLQCGLVQKNERYALSFHSLRATAVTFLLDIGCPGELVRHIVGHDSPEIERRHYYKPRPETEAAWLEKIAESLKL